MFIQVDEKTVHRNRAVLGLVLAFGFAAQAFAGTSLSCAGYPKNVTVFTNSGISTFVQVCKIVPLTAPLTPSLSVTSIAGNVTAKLFASTTGTDSDWVVKLIDVYPEKYPQDWKLSGYELMISDEIFRGRFQKSMEQPQALQAGAVTPFTIDLHTTNHVFKKGHRIMVQVQSSWFPLYDRNPQKFVPNIFESKVSDYQTATQHIYRSKTYPSSVEISVLPAGIGTTPAKQ